MPSGIEKKARMSFSSIPTFTNYFPIPNPSIERSGIMWSSISGRQPNKSLEPTRLSVKHFARGKMLATEARGSACR
jgi:hypothetical protein